MRSVSQEQKALLYNILFITAGILLIILMLYPYWIFGSNSALGWFDEYDAIIPWYYSKTFLNDRHGFLYGYAGGTGGAYGFPSGGEIISFYKILITHFNLWIANLIFRFFSIFSLFLGTYYIAKKMHKNGYLFGFAISIFAVSVNNIPYGFSLGGTGWDLSASVWLCIVLFNNFKSNTNRFLLAIVTGFITTITCPFLFLLPLSTYFIFVYAILFCKINLKLIRTSLIFLSLFYLLIAINWFDSFYSLATAKTFSARLSGILTTDIAVINFASFLNRFLQIALDNIYVFYIFFMRMPTTLLLVAYVICSWIGVKTKAYKELMLLFFLSIAFPVCIDLFFKLTRFPLLQQFRWNELWELQSIIFSLYISYKILWIEENLISYLIIISLLITSYFGGKSLIYTTLINLNVDGGVSVINTYEGLKQKIDEKNKYRFISTENIRTTVPLFYQLDTFDGVIENFPFRRSYFIAYAAYKYPLKTLNSHSHVFQHFPTDANIDMFLLANVKYLASSDEIKDPNLKLVSMEKSLLANNTNYIFKSTLSSHFNWLTLKGPLYIYKFTGHVWPRIFSAKNIKLTNYNITDPKFYADLNNISYENILISAQDKPMLSIKWQEQLNKDLKILSYTFEEKNVYINVSHGGGILVFNQVYTPQWHSYCNNNELEIIPVNSIMMAVLVPTHCNKVIFHYTT